MITLMNVVAFLDITCTNFLDDADSSEVCFLRQGSQPSSVYHVVILIAIMVLIDSALEPGKSALTATNTFLSLL